MKKIISLILSSILIATLMFSALPVSAKTVHKSCISLLDLRASKTGSGYEWDNFNKELTLNGLNIKTTDKYGLKIMDGAIVIIKGDNYIEASVAAIFLEAKVLFKGSGTLTLVGGDNGIYCSSADRTDSLSIVGGTYKITSGKAGIVSDFHKIAISGCKITVDTESGVAIDAQTLTTGAKTVIKANGSLIGHNKLQIESSSITVDTDTQALVSDNPIVFSKVTLKAGSSKNDLHKIDLTSGGYASEKCVRISSLYNGTKKSLVFGGNVPIYVDIILLIAVIAALGCAVVLPVIYKKKKAQAAIALRDAEQNKGKNKAKK